MLDAAMLAISPLPPMTLAPCRAALHITPALTTLIDAADRLMMPDTPMTLDYATPEGCLLMIIFCLRYYAIVSDAITPLPSITPLRYAVSSMSHRAITP